MESEQDLPISFWGNVAAPAEAVPTLSPLQQVEADRLAWEQSFATLGLNVHELMTQLYGQHSKAVGHEIRTFEDLYKHVTAPPESTVENKADRKSLIEKTRAEWHEAVRQRNDAKKKWDEYVAEKHDAFRKAKNAL